MPELVAFSPAESGVATRGHGVRVVVRDDALSHGGREEPERKYESNPSEKSLESHCDGV